MIALYCFVFGLCGSLALYFDIRLKFGFMAVCVIIQMFSLLGIAGEIAERKTEKEEVEENNNMGTCVVCGRVTSTLHHLIFGSGRRTLCDRDKLTVFLCDECHTLGRYRLHDNPTSEKLSKMLGQALYERDNVQLTGGSVEDARNDFIRRYGVNYLDEYGNKV